MLKTLNISNYQIIRCLTSSVKPEIQYSLTLLENTYSKDDFTNVTDKIASHLGRNLHTKEHHPLSHVRQRIVNYFYKKFVNGRGNPIFSVYDALPPVVSVDQNFDSLLTPKSHPSRSKSDCYYLNRDYLLRAHMTAHQSELMRAGLNNFLMIGDVYRRDEIDRTHYPIFHQIDAVRLKTRDELFPKEQSLEIFELGNNTQNTGTQQKQACHTLEAVKLMEHELKTTLTGLAKELFGEKIEYRWIDTYFPFTQPSWELEVCHENNWLELLGCGIMRQPILTNSGIVDRIGWAFGIGLERVAMCLYKIPDIRLFWSSDTGFLNQFKVKYDENVTYKQISQFPQCISDLSFWLPQDKEFSSNDFYDLARNIGGDTIEQIVLVDEFTHPKHGKTSHCYRIIYRHMEKTLVQSEVNLIHSEIAKVAASTLGVQIR
ncbi:probable phenylalanine--tRNA ligase, mitochondrial [Tribolium madens]|uniref:probable phenylalanine--tRNA ligase, mitochondrial n=1 Tax=Tribolium madens TaxID=41895 RepID=UPI001CF72335|nr:probable phenylalanine--tRNA ligase, mitochondrial [Tribolium madens]